MPPVILVPAKLYKAFQGGSPICTLCPYPSECGCYNLSLAGTKHVRIKIFFLFLSMYAFMHRCLAWVKVFHSLEVVNFIKNFRSFFYFFSIYT